MKKNFLFIFAILVTQSLISQNENFEDASITNPFTPSTITVVTSNAVNGWTITGGSNSTWGATGNCTNTTAITGNPNACNLISPGATGHIDAIIGSIYPIFSVFGPTTTTYPAATTANGFQCYGDWFIKINNQTPGSSVNRIAKTINVTPSNALFNFAFINVMEGGHCCCDNAGFKLKLFTYGPGCSGPPTPTICPSFTAASAAGTGCSPSGNCASLGNNTSYSVCPGNLNWTYNKWKLSTIDLSSFIGSCVIIEVTAFDCPYSTHAGYTYFDAQTSPLEIIMNGMTFPMATPYCNIPTCGTGATASLTAPPVAGGYTWTCPGPYTITSSPGLLPGQQIATSIAGNYTLVMNPPGSCSPIIRVLNLISTNAPNLAVASNTNYTCSNPFLNGVSINMASGTPDPTTTPNYNVNFYPALPSGTVGVAANSGTYTGLSVGINTITITDSIGCYKTTTLNVTPVPTIPSFYIAAPNGTVVGCIPPTVPLNAINTNTAITGMTYTWTSSTQPTSVTSSYNAYGNTTYTVFGSASGSCIMTTTVAVAQSTVVPNIFVNPITQSLTCNGGCKTFTASTSSGTANIVGSWYGPGGSTIIGPSTTPLIFCANSPGTYTAEFCSTINGCCTSQTVAVAGGSFIPSMQVCSSINNINCTGGGCIPMACCLTSGTLAPTTYTWTNLTTSISTTPASGSYTACTPGKYLIEFMDGNFCKISQTVTVGIDTLRPSPISMTNLSGNSYTVNCFTSSLIATAITNPMLPASSYSWISPPSTIINSGTVGISLANITSSTSPTAYTVMAMGANGCIGKQKVNFYKDIAVPFYGAVFTPSAITCANPCVAMTATTTSTVAVTYTFTSPPPTQSATTAGALMCTPGIYTLTYQNINNGCIGTANTIVPLNITPPATIALSPIGMNCGSNTVVFAGVTNSTSTTYSYTWDPPVLAGMSCAGGTACVTSSVNTPGVYQVYILNTINGCSSTNSVLVNSGLGVATTGNNTICIGETSTLTASGATSYTWSTGSNSNSITVSPTITSTYSVAASTGSCAGQSSLTVTVNPCVGIKEFGWSKNISIAPNPNNGKFNVEINTGIENGEIRLINNIGQEVFKQNIKQGNNEINTGVLAKGIYYCLITQNKEPIGHGKILVE